MLNEHLALRVNLPQSPSLSLFTTKPHIYQSQGIDVLHTLSCPKSRKATQNLPDRCGLHQQLEQLLTLWQRFPKNGFCHCPKYEGWICHCAIFGPPCTCHVQSASQNGLGCCQHDCKVSKWLQTSNAGIILGSKWFCVATMHVNIRCNVGDPMQCNGKHLNSQRNIMWAVIVALTNLKAAHSSQKQVTLQHIIVAWLFMWEMTALCIIKPRCSPTKLLGFCQLPPLLLFMFDKAIKVFVSIYFFEIVLLCAQIYRGMRLALHDKHIVPWQRPKEITL